MTSLIQEAEEDALHIIQITVYCGVGVFVACAIGASCWTMQAKKCVVFFHEKTWFPSSSLSVFCCQLQPSEEASRWIFEVCFATRNGIPWRHTCSNVECEAGHVSVPLLFRRKYKNNYQNNFLQEKFLH